MRFRVLPTEQVEVRLRTSNVDVIIRLDPEVALAHGVMLEQVATRAVHRREARRNQQRAAAQRAARRAKASP